MIHHDLATQEFDKARSLARWSFIGFLVPILGIVFGSISRGRLRKLKAQTPEEAGAIVSVMTIATWGIIISVCMIIAGGAFGYWHASELQKENERAAQQAEREKGIRECTADIYSTPDDLKDLQLNYCQARYINN